MAGRLDLREAVQGAGGTEQLLVRQGQEIEVGEERPHGILLDAAVALLEPEVPHVGMIDPALQPIINKKYEDVLIRVTPITLLAHAPFVLTNKPQKVPVRSLQEFAATT